MAAPNEIGNIYEKLTVLKIAGRNKHGKATWLVSCNCGSAPFVVVGANLRNKHTRSCGCLQLEWASSTGKYRSDYQLTNKQTNLTNKQHEVLEGWLLSDGSLRKSESNVVGATTTAKFQLSLTHRKEAIDGTRDTLPFVWRERHIIPKQTTTRNNKPKDDITSLCDKTLNLYYERWYPNGKKVIPLDFKITPTTLRYAIYGDGAREKSGISLCLQAFSNDDLHRLTTMIKKEVGVEFRISKKRTLYLIGDGNSGSRQRAFAKLINYTGSSDYRCFDYKFNP